MKFVSIITNRNLKLLTRNASVVTRKNTESALRDSTYQKNEGVRMKLKLIEKFRKREARIAIVGLGRIGLPTAAFFAGTGYQVIGVDIRSDVVQAVSLGEVHTKEHGLEGLVRKVVKSGKLKASTETVDAIRECDVVIVCVQTPLDGQRKPDLTYLGKACEEIAQGLGQ